MSTLRDLIRQVRGNINDFTSSLVSDSAIINFLNEAQVKLSQVTCSVTTFEVSVNALTNYVQRPVQLLAPQAVYFRVNDLQQKLDISRMYPEETEAIAGFPEVAHFLSDVVYLRPVPSDNGTLVIVGTARPVDMVNLSDQPSIQDADDVIVAYVTWKCYAMAYATTGNSTSRELMREWNQTFMNARQEWVVLDSLKNPSTNRARLRW